MADENAQKIITGLEEIVDLLETYPVRTECLEDGRWGLHIENEAWVPLEEAWHQIVAGAMGWHQNEEKTVMPLWEKATKNREFKLLAKRAIKIFNETFEVAGGPGPLWESAGELKKYIEETDFDLKFTDLPADDETAAKGCCAVSVLDSACASYYQSGPDLVEFTEETKGACKFGFWNQYRTCNPTTGQCE